MKFNQKVKASLLRKRGLSYGEIQKKINVSKSTLSHWLRDITLSHKQKEQLFSKKTIGAYKGAKTQQRNRIFRTKTISAEANKEFEMLFGNTLFLSGLLLYWAEGDKHKAEMVKFTNSDPAMIKLMMKWFREICHIPENKFRIALHIHNLHTGSELKKYWSSVTNIPLEQFHKTYMKHTSLHTRRNVLYNGTCAIRIYDVSLFRRIIGWKSALINHFNISL